MIGDGCRWRWSEERNESSVPRFKPSCLPAPVESRRFSVPRKPPETLRFLRPTPTQTSFAQFLNRNDGTLYRRTCMRPQRLPRAGRGGNQALRQDPAFLHHTQGSASTTRDGVRCRLRREGRPLPAVRIRRGHNEAAASSSSNCVRHCRARPYGSAPLGIGCSLEGRRRRYDTPQINPMEPTLRRMHVPCDPSPLISSSGLMMKCPRWISLNRSHRSHREQGCPGAQGNGRSAGNRPEPPWVASRERDGGWAPQRIPKGTTH